MTVDVSRGTSRPARSVPTHRAYLAAGPILTLTGEDYANLCQAMSCDANDQPVALQLEAGAVIWLRHVVAVLPVVEP